VAIFHILVTFHCWTQPPYKISWKYLTSPLNDNRLSVWNSRWRPSAIFDFPTLDYWPTYLRTLLIFNYYTKFVAKILIDAQIMGQKQNSPSSIYFRWLFLTYCRLYTIAVNHVPTKFRANVSIHDWIITTFWNSKWRPSAILDFRKSDFWAMGRLGLPIFHHCTKFDTKTLIFARIMAQNQNSRLRLPPSWIYFQWLFLTYTANFPLQILTIVQNFMKISDWTTDRGRCID